ncbi:hypothetical protein ACFLUO_07210 [Chloroflexota bacterium]
MIDTIVLILSHDEFRILDHNKFSPSTEGLYNHYYRLGSRSNLICRQNPSPSELRGGIYKPRLSVTKRIDRYHNYETTLKVEFSAPKLLFGNNFDELNDIDFPRVVQVLKQKLEDMGVDVPEGSLINASVSTIHFSKNILLTDYTTPYTYLSLLTKININQRLDMNQTDFRNGGHSLKYRANSFEIAFYDKLKDLDKAKISERRAEERENSIQLNLFENIRRRKAFEILRMEVRLNKRQKIRQVLKCIELDIDPVFQSLFNKEIARKILLYYLKNIEAGYPPLLLYDYKNPELFLSELLTLNPKIKLRRALAILGLRDLIDKKGVREFREIINRFDRTSWYRLKKEMESISYPEDRDSFAVLRNAIEEFKSLKIIDFTY